jgi:NAD(P)H dehydrogenase (quinone)
VPGCAAGGHLYTSHQGTGADSPFHPARDHAATEKLLAGSGVPWTSLRNGFYAHSLGWLLGPWQQTGTIRTPADGPVSWTDRADAAKAAAVILTGNRTFEGPVTLTASQAVTFDDIAAMASKISDREVKRIVMDDEEWIATKVAGGTPEAIARMTLTTFQAAREGRFAGVDPLLAGLLEREPRSAADQIADSI